MIKVFTSKYKYQLIDLILELQNFELKFDSDKTTNRDKVEKYLEEMIEETKDNGEILLKIVDDEVIGFISWNRKDYVEFDKPHAYISDLIVREKYRGKGFGKELLETAIKNIKIAGLEKITIGVMIGNDNADSLYKSFGFKEYSKELVLKL